MAGARRTSDASSKKVESHFSLLKSLPNRLLTETSFPENSDRGRRRAFGKFNPPAAADDDLGQR